MAKINNIFLKSTFILIISGFLTKLIGFIIKIVYTRIIGPYGISLYALATPTYSLLLAIAPMAIPIALAKIIAAHKGRSIQILITAAAIILIVNFLLIIFIFLTAPLIANTLLKEPRLEIILKAMALTLPFISISSVLKGYFAGKQNLVPHATSNVIEQIIRLTIIALVLPILMKKNVLYAVLGLVLLTIISEICSIIVFLFFLPKNISFKNVSYKPNSLIAKDILNISLPTVSSRIIGNIGYFLEPIILTHLLLKTNFTHDYILAEYGAYNAYSISLLTIPAFFISAIATALIPDISKNVSLGNKKLVKRRIKQCLSFALAFGFLASLIIFMFRDNLLYTLYNTTLGSNYIKILAPFFVLFYLEGILNSVLQALGKSLTIMKISFLGVLIKLLVIIISSLLYLGMNSLVIAEIINIIFVVALSSHYLQKFLKLI